MSYPNVGVLPINPGALLKLLVGQLAQGGTPTGSNIPGAGLGDRAFLSVWPDELFLKNPKATQFVVVRPNRFPVWQSVITGAGTPVLPGYGGDPSVPGFSAVVSLLCYTQVNADAEMMSYQAITEDTLGIIAFILKVITAVQFWMPFDPLSDSTYLREPARMTDGGFGLNQRKVGDAWWVSGIVDLELKMTSAFS